MRCARSLLPVTNCSFNFAEHFRGAAVGLALVTPGHRRRSNKSRMKRKGGRRGDRGEKNAFEFSFVRENIIRHMKTGKERAFSVKWVTVLCAFSR